MVYYSKKNWKLYNTRKFKNYSYENSKEVNETGLAGWINDKNSNPKKSIALHNSAVIGTIMKVRNEQTMILKDKT